MSYINLSWKKKRKKGVRINAKIKSESKDYSNRF